MKQKIRLTESQLYKVIKKVVNEALSQNDDITEYIPEYDRGEESKTKGHEYKQDAYDELSNKFKGDGDALERLIRNNKNYTKWYDNLEKTGDNMDSWDAFDEYHKTKRNNIDNDMENNDDFIRYK